MTALLLATYRKLPEEAVEHGLGHENLTLVSYIRDGHYATKKGMGFGGLGIDNLVIVDQDERGRMSVPHFRAAVLKTIAAGGAPPFVCLTTGTTVMGAFDPVEGVIDIAKEFNIWVHIDGSHGGPTIFSANKTLVQERLAGIDQSDSFNMNPQKIFGAVKEVSIFVTQQAEVVQTIAPAPSSQEFNENILYNGPLVDTGVTHTFPIRRANVFKAWFMWKAKGFKKLGEHVDHGYDLTQKALQVLREKSDVFHIHPISEQGQSMHINFYYIPKVLRDIPRNTNDFYNKLNATQTQKKLVKSLILHNEIVITVKTDPSGKPPFLVLPLYNSWLTLDDVKYQLDLIEYFGDALGIRWPQNEIKKN